MERYRLRVDWNTAQQRYEAAGYVDYPMPPSVVAELKREIEIESMAGVSKVVEPESTGHAQDDDYGNGDELERPASTLITETEIGTARNSRSTNALIGFLRMHEQNCKIAENICNAQSKYLQSKNPECLRRLTYLDIGSLFSWNEATTRRAIKRMLLCVDGCWVDADVLVNCRENPGLLFALAQLVRNQPKMGAPALCKLLLARGHRISERNVGKMLLRIRSVLVPVGIRT